MKYFKLCSHAKGHNKYQKPHQKQWNRKKKPSKHLHDYAGFLKNFISQKFSLWENSRL